MQTQSQGDSLAGAFPRRRAELASAPVADELALYVPNAGKAIVLNRSAAAIWELCDGRHTSQSIADELAEAAGVAAASILDDVRAALEQFVELGIVEELS